jgi:hypothetical protein
MDASSWLDYTFVEGVLRYKNKIVIGKKRNLRERLASVAHD